MQNKLKLKTKIIGGFIIVAIITLVIGAIGWSGVSSVSKSMKDIGSNYLPSVESVLIISQAQTDIDSAENFLLAPEATKEQLQQQYDRITAAYQRANDARKIYEALPQTPEEKISWDKFALAWDTWKKADDEYVALSKQYEISKSKALRTQMVQLALVTQGTNFAAVDAPLHEVIDINKTNAANSTSSGESSANTDTIISFVCMILGSILALVIGIFLGNSITKPMLIAVNSLSDSAEQVAAASQQLSSSSQQLAASNSEQASSIEETSATLEESSSMIKQNSENTKQAAHLAELTKASADKGNVEMKEMMNSMSEIKKSSDKIAKVIKVIDDIAFQTNILALNAAVEAARAGDAGMGFAVVAEEVRNLAQRSAQAAKDTAMMIENNIELSEKGVNVSDKVAEALSEITLQAKKVNELMDEISAASQEQTQGISQINRAISQMETATQQNAATAEESAAASEELSAQAQSVNETVQQLLHLVNGSSNQMNMNVNTKKNYRNKPAQVAIPQKKSQVPFKSNFTANNTEKTHGVNPEDVIPLDFNKDDF